MSVRPRPVRLAFAVIAFYAIVYGLAIAPPVSGKFPRRWSTVRAHLPAPEAKPKHVADPGGAPVAPPGGVPYSTIPAIPGTLASIAEELVRPETREWLFIVVHHSGGAHGNAAEFDRMHREINGWEYGLGYHFVVGNGNGSPAGCIEPGGRWLAQLHGAHAGSKATEYNQHGIGICVVGNYEETAFPEEVYPALRDLVVWLAKRYSIPPEQILPHREVRGEPTDCPGKNFPLERLRDDVRSAMK